MTTLERTLAPTEQDLAEIAETQPIDGIATGERLRRKMVDAWLEVALACFELADDKEALKEFRAAFGRNPKHIIKAVERFPEVWHSETSADLYDLLATIQLSKVALDGDAQLLYRDFQTHKDYDLLKESVKVVTQHARKPKATLAERCAEIVWMLRAECVDAKTAIDAQDKICEMFAGLPEVAAALALRNGNGGDAK